MALLRVEEAQKLLQHSSMSVARVARLVGYRDPLYFSRIYRRWTGHPPSGRARVASRPIRRVRPVF